mmetsp:Transcript_12229/g.25457  ORF Transcript_12229/g.25457 Transcript_12229/m.25457 type:complete len:81 (+) Transcript_12229:255-497(+)
MSLAEVAAETGGTARCEDSGQFRNKDRGAEGDDVGAAGCIADNVALNDAVSKVPLSVDAEVGEDGNDAGGAGVTVDNVQE